MQWKNVSILMLWDDNVMCRVVSQPHGQQETLWKRDEMPFIRHESYRTAQAPPTRYPAKWLKYVDGHFCRHMLSRLWK